MTTLDLSIGSTVFHKESRYTIVAIIGLEQVSARSHTSGKVSRFFIKNLSSLPEGEEDEIIPKQELINIPDEDWIEAQRKAALFTQVVNSKDRVQKLKEVADELHISESHAYKMLQRFKETDNPMAFLRKKRSDKGKSRASSQMEQIIQEAIDNYYLTEQKISVTSLYDKIKLKVRELQSENDEINLKVPHINTIRNRISDLSEGMVAAKRLGREGKENYRPLRGSFPEVPQPLGLVQIDHTPIDVIIVDDESRLSIGRPTLTLAIDAFSRMVTGFYLSFEKPSALLVGCCLTHSILEKSSWMLDHNIKGEWPVYGVMGTVHADNGKEFHSGTIKKACDLHKINLEWRPVRTPRYGGYIERIFGTLINEIHNLPGTTFSNVHKKGEYQSDKKATLTLHELETWLTEYIVNVYHLTPHSGINGLTPLQKFEQGVLGDGINPGSGLPPKVDSPLSLKLDFLPYLERSVQKYGVQLHGVHYYHDTIRKWIKQKDKNNKPKKFIVRYDPRDLSKVFFYDPEIESYIAVPYRNISFAALSLWELRAIKAELKKNQQPIDEDTIFDAKHRMENIVRNAKIQTKHTRRHAQKEKVRKNHSLPSQIVEHKESGLIEPLINNTYTAMDEDIDYDDIGTYEVEGK